MKRGYRKSIKKVFGYCRWNHKYPPDDWCIIGLSIWWQGPEYFEYRICFFGFEIRVGINRKYIS